jgi:hypothetical protein
MLHKLALTTGIWSACMALAGAGAAAPPTDQPQALQAPKSPAKKAPAGKTTKKSALDLEALQKALESGDEARSLEALERIAEAREPQAAPLIDALLVRGASTKVLLRAIEVVKELGQSASATALVPYVGHRNPELRRAAARALAHTKSPEAVVALRHALRSNDAAVRAAAARGLGTLGAREAVEDLFAVLPKDVPDAAQPIGNLCNEAQCERFIDFLGKLPFDVIESGFEPIFLRPASEVSDELKIKLVERIRRLATKSATELLERTRAVWPADGSPKVKQAIEAALKGRPVGAGSQG